MNNDRPDYYIYEYKRQTLADNTLDSGYVRC